MTGREAMYWKFKNPKNLKISKINIMVNSATFGTGCVDWTLHINGTRKAELKSGENEVSLQACS